MKPNKNLGLITIFTVLIITSLVLSSFVAKYSYNIKHNDIPHLEEKISNLNKILSGAEWVCITERCSEWVYGDDWITDNCRPMSENKTLMCKVKSNLGKEVYIPLTMINISKVKSCREYECVTNVFVKEIWR